MKKYFFLFLICATSLAFSQNQDSLMLRKLYDYHLTQSKTYSNLEGLCIKIGARLSGSPQAEQAVQWAKKVMYAAGADTVFLQPCKVPHWVRGEKEKCIVSSSQTHLNCLALGGSVGTGEKGIKANVVEVKNFDELETLGEKNIKGKIVFYNVFFDQSKILPMDAYREVGKFRFRGASYAAKYGAVACVVRSLSSVADDEPHTGSMFYDTTISAKKIPAFALSYKAADKLHAELQKDKNTQLYVESYCQTLPPVQSFNVIGQINGSEKTNTFIVAGGHLDSWDVGQGAHDDGAGVVQCIELLSAFKKTGIKPKHNIRVVAFMNEENGTFGGEAYAKFANEKNEKHISALETDAGGYTPRSFDVDTINGLYNLVVKWKNLFSPYLIERINKGGHGSDIHALGKSGVPCIGFSPDNQRYFDIHHSNADTFDKVNKRELELCGAAISSIIYLIDKYYE